MSARTKQWLTATGVVALLTVVGACLVWLFVGIGVVEHQKQATYYTAEWIAWAAALGATALAFRLRGRTLTVLLIGGAVVLGGLGMAGRPINSTDSARYNWDGIVQLAGIDPYSHAPASSNPALVALRPAWLFHERQRGEHCPKFTLPAEKPGDFSTTCTAINRPLVPTIYPPVAEGLFALARLPFAASLGYLPTQLLGLLGMLGTTLLLLYELRRTGHNLAWAGLWAWSPYVVTEAVNAAHVDGSATFFAVLATVLVVRGCRIWGGIALGLAIATKFLPVLTAPPLLRRKPWAVATAALVTVVAVYIPHVLATGGAVLGYLPGYLSEEHYDDGKRSALLGAVLPGQLATFAAGALLLVIIAIAYWRTDAAAPWVTQVVIVGSALVLASPKYGWYALLLLPFIVLSRRWEWLPLVALLVGNQYTQWVRDGLPLFLLAQVALVIGAALMRARHVRLIESDRLWRLEEVPSQ